MSKTINSVKKKTKKTTKSSTSSNKPIKKTAQPSTSLNKPIKKATPGKKSSPKSTTKRVMKTIAQKNNTVSAEEPINEETVNEVAAITIEESTTKSEPITEVKSATESKLTTEPKLNATKETMSQKPKSTKNKLNLIAKILACVAGISFIALLVNLFRLNILPTKYLIVIIVGMVFLTAVNLFLAFFKKAKTLRIISIILSILFSAVAIFGFLKINDTINFFANFGSDKVTNTYNIIVANDSKYDENSNLTNQTIYTYRDLTIDSNLVVEAIKTNYNADTEFNDNILALAADLISHTDKIGAINAGTYEAFLSDNDMYKDSFKIIKSFDIITEAEQTHEVDITRDPFVIFLSGIDTRSGMLPSRSLSDVNIVATINPKEHKILLTAIPRDYYVHLAGTPEDSLNDKLTHAGSHGGIALSKATVEELLNIEINYYARVNFNFVKNLVDAIGGIDINSDVDYSFTCWTDKGCTFHPGVNSVDGRCALAFARERKSYSAGDRHRGENQEQVIALILDKISKSSTLLSNYSGILAALNDTFETNIETSDITAFFKNQLEDMKPWKIENFNLNGTGAMDITYSYPSQPLSVMYPDETTIEAAKAKIYEYLGQEYQPAESEAIVEPTEE